MTGAERIKRSKVPINNKESNSKKDAKSMFARKNLPLRRTVLKKTIMRLHRFKPKNRGGTPNRKGQSTKSNMFLKTLYRLEQKSFHELVYEIISCENKKFYKPKIMIKAIRGIFGVFRKHRLYIRY